MDLNWLRSFLSLARTGSFSASAQENNITQPAFSRRIKALENWAGVPLIDRSNYPARLTPAGERFREIALDIDERLARYRDEQRHRMAATDRHVAIATQHSLAINLLPEALAGLRRLIPGLTCEIHAENLHDCVELLVEGAVDFMLSYVIPSRPLLIDQRFREQTIERDVVVPVATGADGRASWCLPGGPQSPLPLLAYGEKAMLQRAVELAREGAREPSYMIPVAENPVSEVLRRMALAGLGVAWLPRRLVAADLQAGRLYLAGGQEWALDLDIRVFAREMPQTDLLETIWRAWPKAL